MICASGYRSSVAASLLRAAGFQDVSWVADGLPAWRKRETSGREGRGRRLHDARRRTGRTGGASGGRRPPPRRQIAGSAARRGGRRRGGTLVYPWPAESSSSAALATIPTESCRGHGPSRTPIDGGSSASTATPPRPPALWPPRRHCLARAHLARGNRGSHPAPAASGASAAAAPEADSARTPAVRGLGAKSLDSARGRGPAEPLQSPERRPCQPGRGCPEVRRAPAGWRRRPLSRSRRRAPARPPATSFGPWEGLDEADSGFEPPDPWVAVGPDDVVQTVNTQLRFTNREGAETEPRPRHLRVLRPRATSRRRRAPRSTIDGIARPALDV